ncbi:ribonuclease P protein subunit p25 [Lutzomyia longipalpis]|uniref:ribonuclease P protein subunit p25 n=1 Tax=Lutzomyia longipalpis TaxID=7200 RepID=UPI002483E1D9|nr:ribonuclease P protein subunit p25 [Lutzomyia longipalpis]
MGKNKKRQRKEKICNVTGGVAVAEESAAPAQGSSMEENCPTMRIKSGTKVENVVRFTRKILEAGEMRKIIWMGCGDAITRTISCAEALRREFRVHQVTEISQEVRREASGKTSYIPSIRILQSLDQIDPSTPGYQNPEGGSQFCAPPRENPDEIPQKLTHGRFPKRRKLEEGEKL